MSYTPKSVSASGKQKILIKSYKGYEQKVGEVEIQKKE